MKQNSEGGIILNFKVSFLKGFKRTLGIEKRLSYFPPSNFQILLIQSTNHICFKISGTIQGLKSFPH